MNYILTGPAARDIDEILDHIAAQSAQTAVIVAHRFEKTFKRIADTPGIGHRRDEIKDANARILSVSGFLVIYDPILTPVHILRVIRGVRDLSRIQPRSSIP